MGRWVTAIIIGCALALLSLPPPSASAQGLKVSGYADLEVNIDNVNSDDSEFYFDNHHFNLIAFGRLLKDVAASAEIEFEHAGDEIALEFGYISYTGIPNVRIQAGKFIVPFGRFNKDLHPTWINKVPDRPLPFDNILPQTYNDVGIWISGGTDLTDGTRVAYDAFVVNGLLGTDGGNIQDFRDNDRDQRTGGRDNNKAVGGRLGLNFSPQGFEIAGSLYYGNYSEDSALDLNLAILGADAAFQYRDLELRGELVHAIQEVSPAIASEDLKKTGFYTQAAYRITPKFEPTVRFSWRNMPDDPVAGAGIDDRSRLSFGTNYYLAANAVVRLAYNLNMENNDTPEADNDKIIGQFTMAF